MGPLKWMTICTQALSYNNFVFLESTSRNHSGTPMISLTSSKNCALERKANIFAVLMVKEYESLTLRI